MNSPFKKELEQLLNKYSVDNDCNTPDFVLAEYIVNVLQSLMVANTQRDLLSMGNVEVHADGVKDAN